MASFTPDANFSPQSNPKDWAYHLGCMPQGAHVVFTKAGLVDFLKTHGIDVGPNFTELSRVPKYATVGRFDKDPASVGAAPAPAPAPVAAAAAAPAPTPAPAVEPAPTQQQQQVLTPDGDVFRPTRRVREPVGGGSAQIGAIFGGGDDNTDEAAKESARRRGLVPAPAPAPTTFPQDPAPSQPAAAAAPAFSADETTNTFRPTRRVREPGGTGGVSSITLG